MGYEISGALGVKMAAPEQEVYAMVGDGSYMMLHSELVTSIQQGKKINVLLFDNAGFGCINNLQMGNGMDSIGTEFRKHDGSIMPIDFAKSASGYGVRTYSVRTMEELQSALRAAKNETVSTLIDIKVLPKTMTDGYGGWWHVGVAGVSKKEAIQEAYKAKNFSLRKHVATRGGMIMFKENSVKLGIAPIGWTNDDMPELGKEITFEQCVSEMALAGFTGTEVGNKYPRDPIALKKALSLRNVEIASAWFSAFLTTKPFEETKNGFLEHRDFLHEMGAKVIVVSEQGKSIQGKEVPLFDEKPIFTDGEWEKLASGLNRLGELANDKGMKLVYHHHMGTGVQTAKEIDRLMEMTDPNAVHLLYDTGHLYYSGENPLDVLKHYLPRSSTFI